MSSLVPGAFQYGLPMTITELRAFAALPAAGAWDATLTVLPIPGFSHIIIYGEYTQGAANGACEVRPEFSPTSADVAAPVISWFPASELSAAVLVPGADVTVSTQAANFSFDPTTAAREGFMLEFDIPPGIERVRVNARETGVVGTPGSLRIRVQRIV